MPVVIGAGRGAELLVFFFPAGIVVADSNQSCSSDRHRIGAERQCLGNVRAGADAAGNDQLHLAMHAEILQRLNGGADAGERRHADIFDEHVLRCRGAALHAVEHDDIGAGLHGKRRVIIGACAADLDVDRLFPVGDLAQFHDLDFEIVRTGPVGMTAGGALVDALRQVAHIGNAVGNLLAEQHAAATGLGALANHDLDRVGTAQVLRVHAVTRRQILVDERLGMAALLIGHAAVAGGGRGAGKRRATAERFLGVTRERPETHAGNGDRRL